MNTLIVFCTSHGTTEKAVQLLSEKLEGNVTQINLKKGKVLNLNDYDSVIIGGSIHVGNVQGKLKKFIKQNQDQLLLKKLGLFLCCMRTGEMAIEQFNHAFPESLRGISSANGLFGGEFLISKMNFIERKIVQKVEGTTVDKYQLNEDEINSFAIKFSA